MHRLRVSMNCNNLQNRISYGLVVMVITTLVATTSARTNDDHLTEYCDKEHFNVSCGADEVIIVKSAILGRMRIGRCIPLINTGNIGCSTDVTSDLDASCSGRRSCRVQVISLDDKEVACPSDLKIYLEARYQCVKVLQMNQSECSLTGVQRITGLTEGNISSVVTKEAQQTCPWSIVAEWYQRLNITFTDYSVASSADALLFTDTEASSVDCRATNGLAVITEQNGTLNHTVCSAPGRRTVVYTTKTNAIEINISPEASSAKYFLIHFKVFGCQPITSPEGAHVTYEGEHAAIRCNETTEAWYLVCHGTDWTGRVGNCSEPSDIILEKLDVQWNIENLFNSDSPFPYGILIVVTAGVAIGVVAGVVMLFCVVAYMKRRRRRKIRSRSTYVLKHVGDDDDEYHKKFGINSTSGSASNLGKQYRGASTTLLKRESAEGASNGSLTSERNDHRVLVVSPNSTWNRRQTLPFSRSPPPPLMPIYNGARRPSDRLPSLPLDGEQPPQHFVVPTYQSLRSGNFRIRQNDRRARGEEPRSPGRIYSVGDDNCSRICMLEPYYFKLDPEALNWQQRQNFLTANGIDRGCSLCSVNDESWRQTPSANMAT